MACWPYHWVETTVKIHFYRIKVEGVSLTVADLLEKIFVKLQDQRERCIYQK